MPNEIRPGVDVNLEDNVLRIGAFTVKENTTTGDLEITNGVNVVFTIKADGTFRVKGTFEEGATL